MDIVVKIVGIFFIFAGIVYLLKPQLLKPFIDFFKRGRRMYFVAVFRFALAIVFLLAARQCDISWLIAAFGIVFMVSGLLIFILGLERVKSILQWYQNRSLLFLRLNGVIALVIGAIIIYSA